MHRLRLVSTAAAIVALSFGVAACGDDDDEGDSGGTGEDVSDASFDLNVGVLVPQTGDLSAFGPAGEKAANMAIEQVSCRTRGSWCRWHHDRGERRGLPDRAGRSAVRSDQAHLGRLQLPDRSVVIR